MLPTKLDIFNHYQHLHKEKLDNGDWSPFTKFHDKVKVVMEDVADIWDKTGIPYSLSGKKGMSRISKLLIRCKELNKVAFEKRDGDFGEEFKTLFDIAECRHEEVLCDCELGSRVPVTWKVFLLDQRGDRKLQGVLSDKRLSLRAAGDRDK